MRKILLGTTALVAAGLLGTGEAAAKFDVTVRGNYTAGYGFVNEDDDEGESGHTRQNQALNQDAEVHFRFEQTLDNGIIVGGRVELEGATHNEREGGSTGSRFSRSAGTDQIDEKWGYVRGGFGELRFGDEDDARKQKSYGAPEASGIFGVNSPYFTYNNTATGQVTSTNSTFPNLENDSAKVIYFTPSFGGFQLAVSYAPDGTQDRAQGGTGGTDESQLSNATSIGADYSGEFGGVTVGLGGGYSFANVENNDEDPSIWAVGVNVRFGGFTVGGSVVFGDELDGGNSAAFNGLTVDEATVFDIGATYTIDAVTVGVGFSRGEYEDAMTARTTSSTISSLASATRSARASISAPWSAGSTMRTRARTTTTIPAGRPASASIWASDPRAPRLKTKASGGAFRSPFFVLISAHSGKHYCDIRRPRNGNYTPRGPHNTLLR